MIEYILLGVLAAILVLLAVLVIRALSFTPKAGPAVQKDKVTVDTDTVIERLRTLVRFKTVSYRDPSLEDDAEFEGLINALPTLYPKVFSVCEFTRLPDRALLFRWKGREEGEPAVLMAHYDVVPVHKEGWSKPAFDAILEDGVIWGRGTLDTKVTFNGILSAAEQLIAENFVPENDIYFAFSGGEEVNGKGAVNIVDYFEQKGITLGLVVDEGGAVVEGVFPGVKEPCGLIGIAEKGMMNVRYTSKSAGGHASAPKPHTPVGVLSAACCKLENNPFPSAITPPVAQMFDTLGRHSNFVFKLIFSNLWLFKPLIDNFMCKKQGGEINALMRTTIAFTEMKGSEAANVIPPEASMVSNMRLLSTDTIESATQRIKKTIGDENVEISLIDGMNPSRISVTDCAAYDKVATAVASTWKGAIVSPYLMVQCSDSRHYGRISNKVYRFSAMDLSSAERATIHGADERIRVDCACRAVEFYIRLIKQC